MAGLEVGSGPSSAPVESAPAAAQEQPGRVGGI